METIKFGTNFVISSNTALLLLTANDESAGKAIKAYCANFLTEKKEVELVDGSPEAILYQAIDNDNM